MAKLKLNGITIDTATEYVKDQKNIVLNTMLGTNGEPKYSVNQMKNITKAMLLTELVVIVEEALKTAEQSAPKEMQKRGAKRRPVKNKKCAQSKKCHILDDVANKRMTAMEALIILDDDYWLKSVLTREEVLLAESTGQRPGRAKVRVQVVLDVELAKDEYVDQDGYIVATGG